MFKMMEGLQIWAHSFCRSTLATYSALGVLVGVPFRILVSDTNLGVRQDNGFDRDEFANLELVEIGKSAKRALQALEERQNWYQFFGAYQDQSNIQAAIASAINMRLPVGIGSEAPCNMFEPGPMRFAKDLYINVIAKYRFKRVAQYADFIVNWSGDDLDSLTRLGWHPSKIIPFGYFPPPLPESRFIARCEKQHSDFHILCTGNMTWHRGPDILMQSLVLLKKWGFSVRATFTSDGPLMETLKDCARANQLKCHFPGFVSMQELVALYQDCSIFVAPGRAEPWGMRVNDALQCGAPIVISDAMGAVKMVNDYGVGLSYRSEDAYDLASKIREVITAPGVYSLINRNLIESREILTPHAAAGRLARSLMTHLPYQFAEHSTSHVELPEHISLKNN